MKEYKIRIYRDNFNRDRWQTFTISYKESDLCIGIDTASYVPEMNLFAGQILRELRLEMDAYITNDPTYAVILPLFPGRRCAGILVRMAEAAATAGVGPMAAVAGAIAEYIGRRLKTEYDCREVIVENGGDIYADIVEGWTYPYSRDSRRSRRRSASSFRREEESASAHLPARSGHHSVSEWPMP